MRRRVTDSILESFNQILTARLPDAFPGRSWHEICNLLRGAMLQNDAQFIASENAIGLFVKFPRRFDLQVDIDEVFCLARDKTLHKSELVDIYKDVSIWGSKFGARKIYVDACTDLVKADFKELFPKMTSFDEMPFLRIP